MIKQTILLIFLVACFSLNSQEYFESTEIIKERISKANLDNDIHGKKIFDILALANNKSINDIVIVPKARVRLQAYRNNRNNMECSVSISYTDISGDINYSDFLIDSVLYPARVNMDLDVYNGRMKVDTRNITLSINGLASIIDFSDFNNNRGDFKVVINNIRYLYSEKNIARVEYVIGLLKSYYSYSSLLDYVNNRYSSYALNADESDEDVFVHRIELTQIDQCLTNVSYFEKLNIHLRDPDNISEKIIEFKRYLNRSETLFLELITKNTASSSGWEFFCSNTVSTLNEYLLISENLQPSDAIAYSQVSELTNDSEIENLFLTINNYYSKNNNIGNAIGDCLSDELVKASNLWEKEQYLSKALIMIRNTDLISQWFDFELSGDYYNLYQNIISGLVSSYLRVGSMALATGGEKSGNRYVEKANDLISLNRSIFRDISSFNPNMIQILELNNTISLQFNSIGAFTKAFYINNMVRDICSSISDSVCITSDSIRCIIENDYLLNMFNRIGSLVAIRQYPDAINHYFELSDSLTSFDCTSGFKISSDSIADSLCNILYWESASLLNAEQPVIALEKLLLAHQIQSVSGLSTGKTVELINQAAQSVIIEIVESAKYNTWRNDMEKAEYGLEKATEYNKTFLSESNQKVNKAIDELKTQMNKRVCVDIRNKYNDDIRRATLYVRDKKYLKIPALLTNSRLYLQQYPDCGLDKELLESFEFRNSILLGYLIIYDDVRLALLNRDYTKVILSYSSLTDYYDKNINKLRDVSYYPLDDFIESQNLWALSLKAMEYYIDNGDYIKALDYLHMAIEQGLDPKSEKELITELAACLAVMDSESGSSARDAIREYARGVEDLGFFKMAYIKNRVIVPSR